MWSPDIALLIVICDKEIPIAIGTTQIEVKRVTLRQLFTEKEVLDDTSSLRVASPFQTR